MISDTVLSMLGAFPLDLLIASCWLRIESVVGSLHHHGQGRRNI